MLRERLRPAACVSVTGPGGIGKSRLVRALGARTVSCAELARAEDLFDALVRSFGIDARDPEAAALRAVANDPDVLILDDVDGLIDAAPDALVSVAEARLEGALVTTSTRHLPVIEASRLELGPLEAEDALTLLDALTEASRGASLRDEEKSHAEQLVAALEGWPLALELAAARLRVLGPRALLYRLRGNLDLLKRRPVPGKHHALGAMLEHAWQGLEPSSQRTLAQVSVFVGGFDAEAADAVVRAGDGSSVLDALQDLRDRSLVHASGSRLGCYAPVRRFAAARMLAPEEVAERHAAYFGARAFDADPAWLRREHENLLAVVDRLRDRDGAAGAERALRIVLAIGESALSRGPLGGLAERLAPALDLSARSGANAVLLGRAYALRARVRWRRGEDPAEDLGRARLMADKTRDERLVAEVRLAAAEAAEAETALALTAEEMPAPLEVTRRLLRARHGEVALGSLAGDPDPAVRGWVAFHGGRLGDARRLASESGDLALAAEVRLAGARGAEDGAARAALREARSIAARLGDARLEAEAAEALRAATPDPLAVAADGSSFVLGETHVDLGKRKALRGVLAALADAAGEALAWDRLLAAGWPGEKVRAESGVQRVRVAISTLRKLGLDEVLQTVEGGYRLDPERPLTRL